MSKSAYENAVTKREELKIELQKIEDFLSLYQQFESNNYGPNQPAKYAETLEKTGELTAVAHRRRAIKKTSPVLLKELVGTILKEHGSPMSRRQIVEAIEVKGYVVPGSSKTGYLGSLLHRYKSYISSSPEGGYWFTGYEIGQNPERIK